MMGVALCGWATITPKLEGTTLTLNYVNDGNNDDQNFNINNYNSATTIVLTGDWANKDLPKIGTLVGQCSNNVFLDLSACSNMVSKVKYTGEGDTDWTSNNFVYLPNPNYPEQVTVTGTATPSSKYYYTWGVGESWGQYTGEVKEENGKYYDSNNNELVKVDGGYADENGKDLPSDAEITDNGNGTYSYSYTYTADTSEFKFKDGNFSNNQAKLSGIAFPNHANFTAIPDDFCKGLTNLENVTFGDNLEWVGKLAFYECSNLNNVTFPQTVKVIGLDAFYGCQKFTVVDLRIRDLVKVDAAAFNMADVAKNNLNTVYLPEGENTTLKFFANQVFASSHITELDFSNFLGIDHFAYDGEEHFGETVPSGISNTNRTFTWMVDLKKITLPPNLRHVGDECFFNCPSLETVVFTGEAVYDADCNLTNPLTIGDKAFKNTPAEGSDAIYSNLKSVTFSNNVTKIGEQAFIDAQLTEVILPGSIEEVGKQAFACADPGTITKVVFEEIDKTKYPTCNHAATVVRTEAFNHQTVITDVYVNTVTDITCENWAFDHNITFSQGNPDRNGATLHFPEGHEAHYTNLDHALDNETASDPGLFQKWLTEHYQNAQNHKTGYGWYEFVNTGATSTDPNNPDPTYETENPDELPLVLRTYSDADFAHIVPDGLRAYIVNHVQKNGTNYELTLKRLLVIPAQTGVILFGQPNSKNAEGNYVISMTTTAFKEGNGQPLRRDYWDILSKDDQDFKNYLMPIIEKASIRTVEEGGNQTFTETNLLTVTPYEPYTKGATVEWRNFGLNRMSETANLQTKFDFDASVENYAGFFRILPGTYPEGYAYLHLSADEFDAADGAECVVKEDTDYYKEYNSSGEFYDPRNGVHGWWDAPNTWNNMIDGWGTRNDKFNTPGAVRFLGELEDTDGIVKMVIPEDKMGEVFSISGMKVTNPSKGIYIQNGKKVIIK